MNKDYIATKLFRNKNSLENKHDIANNIEQYAGVNENILLDTHATLQQAIKNNIFRIKRNGKIETIGARREKTKAKMKSIPKKLLALPVIGLIIYIAMYGHRHRKFSAVKQEEERQLKHALINALETNPAFLNTAIDYINDLTDPREQKIYQQCLEKAQQNLSKANAGQYDDIIDETIEYLRTENAVNMDKQILKEMYKNNVPEQLRQQIHDLGKEGKMSFTLNDTLDNSKLLKKFKQVKDKALDLGK